MVEVEEPGPTEAIQAPDESAAGSTPKEWPTNVIQAARDAAPQVTDAVTEAAEFLLTGPFLDRQVPPGELANLAAQLLDDMVPPNPTVDGAGEESP